MDFKKTALEYLDKAIDWLSANTWKLVVALLILVIGLWIVRRLSNLTRKVVARRNLDETLGNFLANIIYWAGFLVVLIAAAGHLGIDTMSFVTVLGAAGLAVGLALKDSLSNFAAGVMIVIFRPFKVADYVEAGGTAGVVEKISIFNTHLTTPDNKLVILPNGAVIGGAITNYTAKETRRVDLVFGVSYGDDIKLAKEILHKLMEADERILADPAPVVAVKELGDSSVNFAVRPWVKTADYWDVTFDLTEKVKLTFDERGISIPFPQRDVHLYNEKTA